MPDGVAETIAPDDFERHDGNVVDLQLTGLARISRSSDSGDIEYARMNYTQATRFEFTEAG